MSKTHSRRKALTLIWAVLGRLAAFQAATASIVVQLDSVQPDLAFPGNYRWSFSATASASDGFISGGDNYFTLYDLPGSLITVESGALYWSGASSQLSGLTPAGETPSDDPGLPNVTFRYSSLSSRPGNAALQAGDVFDIILSAGTPVDLGYSWQDYSAYPVSDGRIQSGVGAIAASQVPEPVTAGLMVLGLTGLAVSRRKGARSERPN